MRKLSLTIILTLGILMVIGASGALGQTNGSNTSQARSQQETTQLAQTSSNTLGDWCQAPSWAFGLPNIVTYMGIVGIIAIFSTFITIVVQSRQKPLPIAHERQPGPPEERSAAGGADKKIFTDRSGKIWQIEEGTNHHFLIFQDGKTYSASHDGSWREVTIRFEGENYLYTDNSGKGRYLCTRPGAPFGNFFKLESPAQAGAEV